MTELLLCVGVASATAGALVGYFRGHLVGHRRASDSTFGPVAAWGRVEAASDRLEELAEDEPIPYVPTGCTDQHCGWHYTCSLCRDS
jgi:hypothetical protein